MPELPEVETIRRDLEKFIVGRELKGLKVKEQVHLLKNCTTRELQSVLVGQKLNSIGRRGKFLLFNFEERIMVLHLRMSGRLLTKPSRHTRMVLEFSDDVTIYFDDARRFGTLHLAGYHEIDQLPSLRKLGLEPFSDEYSIESFREKIVSTQEIKRWLLDQSNIAGLGNIYANEALFIAGVNPMRTADSLSEDEKEELFKAIPLVLSHAIEAGGTSIRDYETPSGELGNFQNDFQVYDQYGELCSVCGRKIRKLTQAGRSSYFCPECQPL
jgi:formamidopyrimidine-DNA glycosylase